MAWSKTKTVVAASAGVVLVIALALVVLTFRARAAREKDFVAYEIRQDTLLQKIVKRPVDENALRNQMVGSWEMRAARSWGQDYNYLLPGNHRYKIFTLTNWCIVDSDANGTPVFSAGGAYTLKGNLYTESIDKAFGFMSKYLGAHPRFNIRVEGDKYYQMGTGPKPFIEEMWQRVPNVPVPDPPQ